MDPTRIRALLDAVAAGRTTPEAALGELRDLPYRDLGFARVDNHRALRHGYPEVVFGEGKTVHQVEMIMRAIHERGQVAFATRIDAEKGHSLHQQIPGLRYDPVSRTALLGEPRPARGMGTVCIVSAGTSDQPVAEEAAVTCEVLGNAVDRVCDVGVAGLHRLLAEIDRLRAASVLVVVAGMEGALASVVGGLVSRPVIAVPTSVGYGANFGGVTTLLSMLTSCTAGVTVVNIDNGFGAAYAASLINHATDKP